MPELPDVEVYLHALRPRVLGTTLLEIRLRGPSLLRSVQPKAAEAHGREVVGLRRVGKRIVIALEDELFLVLHLMVAGRLFWHVRPPALNAKHTLAVFDFDAGSLLLREVATRKRASLFVVRGEEALGAHDPGGLEVLDADFAAFDARLRAENHTLKRALSDPKLFSGIGNAYSDEILHRARLSPFALSARLSEEDARRLHASCQELLREWTERLRADLGEGFPTKVTAFRPEMAVHGKFGEPCPICETKVQRIRYASTETNYCPRCQTGGKLLADRSLSRLLRDDWPKSLEELEERYGPR